MTTEGEPSLVAGGSRDAIGVAVIGCGQWGLNHVRVFNSLEGVELLAVVDAVESRLEQARAIAPQARCESGYERVLVDPAVDCVVVATPAETHHEIARASLLAGKHVLCEKPLCTTGSAAADLVATAEAASRLVMVGHVFLFNSGIVKLKELIDSGELGDILYLSATRTNLGPIRSDVNVVHDLASHDISIFNWLLGEPPRVASAVGSSFLQPSIDDVAFISLRYPSGTLGSVHVSWLEPKKVRQLTVVGTRRMATWDDLTVPRPVAVYDKGASSTTEYGSFGEFIRLSLWDGDVTLPSVDVREPLLVQASAFVAYLRDGRIARSDGAFGAEVVAVLDAVGGSLAAGGNPEPISSAQPSSSLEGQQRGEHVTTG